MVTGIIGKKVGMTQLFEPDGTVYPATVLQAGPCVVAQVKTVGDRRLRGGAARAGRSEADQGKQADAGPFQEGRRAGDARAARGDASRTGGDPLKPGDQVNVSMFANGDRVDIIGTSRGKGFQGVVKRHHFRGGRATHGSMFHRAPGSIGASSYPSRVVKGMRMGGHMGSDRVTVRNLKVLRVDAENNLLLLEGAVPGGPNAILLIRKAIAAKAIKVAQVEPVKKKGKK